MGTSDELEKFDGPQNMAEDRKLLERAELGHLGWRVYGWDGPWVSLGCFQRPERDLLDPYRVPWVMRPTGGKAVLHGHDVTVGLAAPLEALLEFGDVAGMTAHGLSRSVRTAYRLAVQPILAALRGCGVPAVLGEAYSNQRTATADDSTAGLRSADCFAVVSPNDIVDSRSGRKVCGCALKLTQHAVLVQASLPNGPPLVDPSSVFANPSRMLSDRWSDERFMELLSSAVQMSRSNTVPL